MAGANPLVAVLFFFVAVIVVLVFYLFSKLQTLSILKNTITHLEKTVTELDHQAKLIIKGDMELKVYQEEVEDKIEKLTFLKNLILSSVHILDREDLFCQINDKIISDLGFKKGILFDFSSLEQKVNVDCSSEEVNTIKDFLLRKKQAITTNHLLSRDSEICTKLVYELGYDDFLIASIKARENVHAIFFLANTVLPGNIRIAEKEIFSILCMYLGQCLDNITLFEDLYLAKDDLEKKIRRRTGELVKSLNEIEIISKTKSDFISSVSHELRTPLTSVKGFSSLLIAEKFGKLPAEAKTRLEKIDINVNKLVDMVNMLLDISRIESGKTEVKIAPADIVKLIKDICDFLSPQIQAKEITLSTDTPENLSVYMDKGLIERVLINLINNALKFTPQGGKIIISCKKEAKQATVSIIDNGCGIPKNDIEKIFGEFYRTQLTKNIQGTGLGLSLVKRIIDTHKEKIWVESEIDKGASFNFTLKLEEAKNV
ncbi:MAG: HAMP domain-containing histidine kinase [Candidatus Omnitrophica bacterium]|nr:HAMP domain-containing histidine kinase [Candidatus Omnitrophota bacterium]